MVGLPREQLGRERLKRQCRAGCRVERVLSLLGKRTVAGAAVHPQPPLERALVGHDDVEFGRLSHDRHGRPPPQKLAGGDVCRLFRGGIAPEATERERPEEPELFSDRRGQDHRRMPGAVFCGEPFEGR